LKKSKSPLYHKRWTLRLFEWAVLVFVLLLLISFFLRRFERLQAEAERLTFQATVNSLQQAVKYGSILREYRPKAYGALRQNGNPVPLLQDDIVNLPFSYLGEIEQPDPKFIAGGQWYFDRTVGVLIYRIQNERYFDSDLSGPARIRYRIVQQDGGGATGSSVAGREEGQLLVLAPQDCFVWK
jgi:hypothetical protein